MATSYLDFFYFNYSNTITPEPMKNLSQLFILMVFFYSFLPFSSVEASLVVTLEEKKELYPLGIHLEYLEDKSGKLSIDEISSPEFDSKFISSQEEVLNFGLTSSTFWVRFQLQAPLRDQEPWLIETKSFNWQQVQLYLSSKKDSHLKIEEGRSLPFEEKIFVNNNTIFRLPIPLQNDQRIYLKFESDIETVLDVRLWSLTEHQKTLLWKLYASGVFQGLLIIMVIYNFFLFLSIKDKSYLYYTFYLSALIGMFMLFDGVGFQSFWKIPDRLIMKSTFFSFALFETFFILFVKSFLNTHQNTPKTDRALSIFMSINILGATLFLLQAEESVWVLNIMVLNTLLVLFAILLSGILCIKNGYKPALFFLLASSSLVGALVVGALASISIFSVVENTTVLFMKIGVLLEAVLYSFALADRYKYERTLKEDSQQQALESLQKAERIKDEFLANTSHELRTPLNGIIGLAEASMSDLKVESHEKLHSNLSLIVSSGRRLSLLVNDILDFSKLKHKTILIHRRAILLHRVVDSVLVLSRTLLKQKPIVLRNQIDKKKELFVWADEARLEQILYNLISNAIKFTHQGEIVVSVQQSENQITLFVSDTGIGIPKEKQKNIFNAFEQIDGTKTRNYEGTGLGLTVVKQLVELHESELFLESTEGQGSTFSFCLPVALDIKADTESNVNIQKISDVPEIIPSPLFKKNHQGNTFSKGFLEILVVDDDPLNLEVICQQLNSKHYSLQVAHNGSEALQKVEENLPDLILLDVMMPELSGFEVCQRLRKQYHQNHLPIIFLTAKNREEDVIRGLELGGNDYLTKPFFQRELIQRVETHLENMLYQKKSDALKVFSNNISHYESPQEMLAQAFEQITQWSLVDEAAIFQGDQLLFHNSLEQEREKVLKIPSKIFLKKIDCSLLTPKIFVANAVDSNHPIGQFYGVGHFLFIIPSHLPDHLLVFYRKLDRNPFNESKTASYVQSMLNQIQTTQDNLQSLFEDNYLVSVIGLVQPRLFEITHVKSTSPTLELHFDSDKRPEYISGCSLEKLSLYFKEALFIRSHKSYLVNTSKVVALQKTSKSRRLNLKLSSGEVIPVGPTYVDKIHRIFANTL